MTGLPRVRALPLAEVPTVCPELRFAVRFAGGRHVEYDAGRPHPLAGAGALWLAGVVDRLAGRDPGLLRTVLTVTAEHRAAARTGSLRRMSGDVVLSVEDALGLVLCTADGACLLALLELLSARGLDVVHEARALAAGLGLRDTLFTGTELTGTELTGTEATPLGGTAGLLGRTTPNDLCVLLAGLSEPVLGWMERAVEPTGLAGGLPGFGPRTVPHHATAGPEVLQGWEPGADLEPGHTAVLVLPGTGVTSGTGGGAVVAAFLPARRQDGTQRTPLEASAVLGTLGLAVHLEAAAQDG